MKSRGFTLIEIIVSLGIFSIVAVIAIGSLVRVTSANRQAQAAQAGVNNVSFIMDTMSRELRTGTGYTCNTGGGLLNEGTGLLNNVAGALNCSGIIDRLSNSAVDVLITFTSANTAIDPTDPSGKTVCNLKYAYLFHTPNSNGTTTIYKAQESACKTSGQDVTTEKFFPLSSQTVNLTDYKVGVFGGVTDHPYGWVFVRLKGSVGIKIKDQSIFDVQMSISQRNNTI